jgi:hypothetical protein
VTRFSSSSHLLRRCAKRLWPHADHGEGYPSSSRYSSPKTVSPARIARRGTDRPCPYGTSVLWSCSHHSRIILWSCRGPVKRGSGKGSRQARAADGTCLRGRCTRHTTRRCLRGLLGSGESATGRARARSIVSGADRRCIAGARAALLLTACRVVRRSSPLHSRRPGRDDGGIISPPDHIARPPLGLTVRSSTPTMAPVIARPVVHGRGLPQGAATRHEIRPLYPRLLD